MKSSNSDNVININGYRLREPLKNDNSGFSKWGFATKNGCEYFIKQFLSPVYPTDASMYSEERFASRVASCESFEQQKLRLYRTINNASKGNLMRVEEFFRVDAHYYITTIKVNSSKLTFEEIAALPLDERIMLCRVVAHSFNQLHSFGVVHGDVKPDNILILKTCSGKQSAKVIDFDCSYMQEDQPPVGTEIPCDILYMAPEIFLRMMGEDIEVGLPADIFSLGLIFSMYLCGKMPEFDRENYDYPYEAVLEEQVLQLEPSIPKDLRDMLQTMVDRDPLKRPTAKRVFETLAGYAAQSEPEIEIFVDEPAAIEPVREPVRETVPDTSVKRDRWFKTGGNL